MEDFFILNGISSLEVGIYVIQLPPISIPERRVEEVEVLGRDGTLTIDDNTYKPIIKNCEVYYNNRNIDAIANFLEDGEVIFSNARDRKYKCKIYQEVTGEYYFENEEGVWQHLNIVFNCQPFGYALDNEDITIATNNYYIYNRYSYYSEPIITVYGSGLIHLFINGEEIQLKDVDEYITINTVKKRTYKDLTPLNSKKIGNFPVLKKGENTISWSGTVTKVVITPNWRNKV